MIALAEFKKRLAVHSRKLRNHKLIEEPMLKTKINERRSHNWNQGKHSGKAAFW